MDATKLGVRAFSQVTPLGATDSFVTDEALALPLLETAGSTRPGDPLFDEIFHPVAERLLARCDAVPLGSLDVDAA